MERPHIAKHVFKVFKKEYLTPHYIRVILQGEGAKDFAKCDLGANNKIMIPPTGQKEVKLAVWDEEKNEWALPPEHERPLIRTYTHRGIDADNNLIVIDFVNHGDNGPASAWARQAGVGDQLGVAMKIRPTILYPESDWYLLVGDATALPVLNVILESLPPTAKGHCIFEVPTTEDEKIAVSHPGFSIEWLHNEHPENGSDIYKRVQEVDTPGDGVHFAYVACEYNSVKNIRQHFKEERKWTNKEFYAVSYWKAGLAEDKSAQVRHDEKHQEQES